jgi:hypothetical protein
MPLTAIEPPEAVRQAAAAHLYTLATHRGAFAALGEVEPENLELIAPHHMYTLPLDAIVGNNLDPRPTGWRFLIADREHVIASAEVGVEGETPAINSGAYVSSTARAIPHLESLPEIENGRFELRLLKIPALYIIAAWLVDDHRIVIPLAPSPAYFEVGHHYDEESFLDALREPAAAIFAADDETSGG